MSGEIITTLVRGTWADGIHRAAKLYLPPGSRVADPTYGRGFWWQKVDWVTVVGSDKFRGPGDRRDLAATGHPDTSFDGFALDPWFVEGDFLDHKGVKPGPDGGSFGRALHCQTTAEIYRDYTQGIREGVRITKPGGVLLVKCQDHRGSGRLIRWGHFAHYLLTRHGCEDLDMFVLDSASVWPLRPTGAEGRVQRHARVGHSFLWVFRRPAQALYL